MTGTAFTLVSPDEEDSVRLIERAIGKRLPRVVVPDFDYSGRQSAPLEVPHAERIAAIRKRKAEDRERAKVNAARRAAGERARGGHGHGHGPSSSSGSSGGASSEGGGLPRPGGAARRPFGRTPQRRSWGPPKRSR
jgi:ATP-dependent RNA helicase RhlE